MRVRPVDRLASWVAAFLLVVVLPSFGQDDRAPVPAKEDLERALKELREIFKADYAGSKQALASKLFSEAARTTSDKTSLYAFLSEARDAAADALDVDGVSRAVGLLSESFALPDDASGRNPLRMKLAAFERARRGRPKDGARWLLAEAFVDLARGAMDVGAYDVALESAGQASSMAGLRRGSLLADEARHLSGVLRELSREFDVAAQADLTRAIDIGAHAKNLAIGRYLAFGKKDWEKGLEYLQWTDNETLVDVAKKELAPAADAQARHAIGEGWFTLSREENEPVQQERYRDRAELWYKRALEDADGILRVKIEKRLTQFPKPKIWRIDLLGLVDPARDGIVGTSTRNGRSIVLPPAEHARFQLPYEAPDEYDLTVVAARLEGESALEVSLSGGARRFMVVIDGWHGISGLELIQGRLANQNETTRRKWVFDDTRPRVLVYSVRKSGVTVTVDGKKVIGWKGDFKKLSLREDHQWKLRSQRTLQICSYRTRYQVIRTILTPISDPGKRIR